MNFNKDVNFPDDILFQILSVFLDSAEEKKRYFVLVASERNATTHRSCLLSLAGGDHRQTLEIEMNRLDGAQVFAIKLGRTRNIIFSVLLPRRFAPFGTLGDRNLKS